MIEYIARDRVVFHLGERMPRKKKFKTTAEYLRNWRAQKKAKANWKACHVCGKEGQLVILDGRPKSEIPPSELGKVKAACFDCLFKDQPLLVPSNKKS